MAVHAETACNSLSVTTGPPDLSIHVTECRHPVRPWQAKTTHATIAEGVASGALLTPLDPSAATCVVGNRVFTQLRGALASRAAARVSGAVHRKLRLDFDLLLRDVPPASTDMSAFRSIEGWMADEAADLSARLARLQVARETAVAVLELGVFKGKYLSLLANLFQDRHLPIVGVDAFLLRIGEMVSQDLQDLVRQQISKTVLDLAPRSPPPTLMTAWTRDVDPSALRRISPGGYSFISVDAGHEARDVEHDLGLAEAVMTDQAVIAADDVFNPKVPGVVEGMCRYFIGRPDSRLAPFACCGNKVFLCTGAAHKMYYDYVKWILESVQGSSYISKSAKLYEQNEQAGFNPSLFGHHVVTFDWN